MVGRSEGSVEGEAEVGNVPPIVEDKEEVDGFPFIVEEEEDFEVKVVVSAIVVDIVVASTGSFDPVAAE